MSSVTKGPVSPLSTHMRFCSLYDCLWVRELGPVPFFGMGPLELEVEIAPQRESSVNLFFGKRNIEQGAAEAGTTVPQRPWSALAASPTSTDRNCRIYSVRTGGLFSAPSNVFGSHCRYTYPFAHPLTHLSPVLLGPRQQAEHLSAQTTI